MRILRHGQVLFHNHCLRLKILFHPFDQAIKMRCEHVHRFKLHVHSLWGYGFLVVLSEKNADDPLNNMDLMSKIEIVLNPNGSVDKAGIVVSSGEFLFDVAAASVINAAAPFLPTPQVLRSYDNKVYLHWRFYRGNRQCGTFGVDKFILNGS